jgi:hypothetical protein
MVKEKPSAFGINRDAVASGHHPGPHVIYAG